MRTLFIFLLTCCLPFSARSQTLRYWFDGDDSSQQMVNSANKSWSIEADISALADYVHALHIQVRDTAGVWSGVATRFFLKVPTYSSTGETHGIPVTLRYWFDGDDANAKQVTATDGMFTFDADFSALSDYVHTIHVQVQDDKGVWGGVATRYFLKMPPVNVSQETHGVPAVMRYWFDGDDANAKQTIVTDGMVSIDVDFSALSDYVHTIHVQVQDDKGVWGGVATRYFLKMPAINISQETHGVPALMRYWFDGDDMNAKQVALANGMVSIDEDIAALSDYVHALHLQVQDDKGVWGGVATRYFVKVPVIISKDTIAQTALHLVYQLEDSIPHSQSVSLVDGKAVFSLAVDGLSPGEHTINYFFVNNRGERTEDMSSTFEFVDWPLLVDAQGVKFLQNDSMATNYTVWGYTENVNGHVEIPEVFQGKPVTSINECAFQDCERLKSIVVPQTVAEVGRDIFLRASNLLAVDWNSPVDITADYFDALSYQNSNFLVYVSADTHVEYAGNVVRDGKIAQLTLADGKPLHVLKSFHADSISYTRYFSKPTYIGESAGWETLVLPFDVQTVQSENVGMLTPFAISQAGDHPYWLAEMGSGGNFINAAAIKANVPYIIAMPNNPEYGEDYNVVGKVVFTAFDADVKPNTSPAVTVNRRLIAAYETVAAADSVYAVNDEVYTPQTGGDIYYAGSVFVRNLRDVRPFEAYLTLNGSNSKERFFVPINNSANTGIQQIMLGHPITDEEGPVHDLTGRRVADNYAEFLRIRGGLQSGVYLVGKRKLLVK